MKAAISLLLQKNMALTELDVPGGPANAGPKNQGVPVTDAALERIVRRSRTAPPGSEARTVKAKTVEVNLITNGEDLEQLSALYRAAARTPLHKSRLPAGVGLWLVALGVAAAAFLSGVFLARHAAKEMPGLLLQSTDAHRTLVIRWNYNAVQNLKSAMLYIDDGGRFITVPLNRSRLASGYFPYPRKFSLVTVTMVAGDMQGVTSFAERSQRRRP
jgi:hypothetical protein